MNEEKSAVEHIYRRFFLVCDISVWSAENFLLYFLKFVIEYK